MAGVGNALNHAQGQIGGLVRSIGPLVGVAGIAGIGLALKGVVTSAMDFQSAMEMLKTQTGATQQEVDSMSASVLDMAKALPQGPNELAAGLYHVESAGYRGAKALDILKIAAQGAATGGADLESVTNAIVGAEQSGVKGAENLGMAMGTLNAIVGSGNMRMQDLADAMSSGILATAKTFGISLQSVGAALATMTDEGIPAADAATRLRMSINLLGAPTARATKELQSIGISQLDLAAAMRSPGGITSAMELLRGSMVKAGLIDTAGNVNSKGAQMLSNAFGGGRSSSAIMTLVGNMSLLEQKTAAVNKGSTGFADAVASAADTAKYKWDTFMSTLQVVGIQIGNAILPSVTEAAKALGDWVGKHSADIVSFFKGAIGAIRGFVSVVSNVASRALGFWDAIPPQLRDLLLKGFAADRTIKWLFGFSPVGALIGAVEGALGKAVGTGLATAGIGKLFVQPVFVTNPGFGAGVPGAGPGVVASGGKSIVPAIGVAAVIDAAAVPIGQALRSALNDNRPTESQAAKQRADAAMLEAQKGSKSSVDKLVGKAKDDQIISSVNYAKVEANRASADSTQRITSALYDVQRAIMGLNLSVNISAAHVGQTSGTVAVINNPTTANRGSISYPKGGGTHGWLPPLD